MAKRKKAKTPISFKDMIKFQELAEDLSPESLHCDGEISASQADAKYNRLMKEWAKLEAKVGRKVDEIEVWDWWVELSEEKQDEAYKIRFGVDPIKL